MSVSHKLSKMKIFVPYLWDLANLAVGLERILLLFLCTKPLKKAISYTHTQTDNFLYKYKERRSNIMKPRRLDKRKFNIIYNMH